MSNEMTAVQIVNGQQLTPSYTQEDLDALKATIAKDCDGPQFKVFIAAAMRLGLDPFARQIVPIVQGGRMTPQTTIDGFRLIAERTHKYAGQIGPFWCGKDGVWHEVWTSDEPPVAARMGVIRHDFAQPLYDVAHMRSYRKKSPTWDQLPIEMLAKVAEARALRRAFPQELSGVYTDDELAPEAPASEPTPIRHARTVEATPAKPQSMPRDSWGDLQQRAARLGVKDWPAFVVSLTGKDDPKSYTAKDRQTVAVELARREAPDFEFTVAEDEAGEGDGGIPSDALKRVPVSGIGA